MAAWPTFHFNLPRVYIAYSKLNFFNIASRSQKGVRHPSYRCGVAAREFPAFLLGLLRMHTPATCKAPPTVSCGRRSPTVMSEIVEFAERKFCQNVFPPLLACLTRLFSCARKQRKPTPLPQYCLQAFVGVTALLASFPPCLGQRDGNEDQMKMPLLTGSVCRVRDSHDFLDVSVVVSSLVFVE